MTVPLLKQRADIEVCENAMKKGCRKAAFTFLFEINQLHFKNQRREGWDHLPGAPFAIGDGGGDQQRGLASLLHQGDALVPTGDDLPHTQFKGEGLVAVVGGVELRAVKKGAAVMHRALAALGRIGALAGFGLNVIQS